MELSVSNNPPNPRNTIASNTRASASAAFARVPELASQVAIYQAVVRIFLSKSFE
jgi:hypothetical protein